MTSTHVWPTGAGAADRCLHHRRRLLSVRARRRLRLDRLADPHRSPIPASRLCRSGQRPTAPCRALRHAAQRAAASIRSICSPSATRHARSVRTPARPRRISPTALAEVHRRAAASEPLAELSNVIARVDAEVPLSRVFNSPGRLGIGAAHVSRRHALRLVPALFLGLARACLAACSQRSNSRCRTPMSITPSRPVTQVCWPRAPRRETGRPVDSDRARHLHQRAAHRTADGRLGRRHLRYAATSSTIHALICATCGSTPSRPTPRPATKPATWSSRSTVTIRKCSRHWAPYRPRAASSPTASTSPASAGSRARPIRRARPWRLIGRVVPIKDVKAYIAAAKMLRESVPDLQAYILGPLDEDPDYTAECKAFVAELGLEDCVEFTGPVNIIALSAADPCRRR